ncbi:DUF5590 domain-containing protein [Robertmurraya korlensis]|uniref:cell wall elongation regulator TseB-like domain-containing protein n=1 Tax=Robertmurraya korlensis TaxID=519977 RepID=UPI00203D7FEF|nr:DUF5590 domain-containing protein [Robertmurraya korlensis]MCM3599811.1 DUF5590 domain-containing protein [Robertmurraya korlensis]
MKKWFWIAIIGVMIVIGITIKIYLNATAPIADAESRATAIAKEETEITDITEFSLYHGSDAYYVVQGSNKKGEKLIAWIPEKGGKIVVLPAEDGITKSEAINTLSNEVSPDQIIDVRLGMEKNNPLWEIYYRSNNNKINYFYIDFETGEEVREIKNL